MLVPGNRVVVCRAPNSDISGSLKILLFDDMKNERSTKSMSQFFRTSSGADLPQVRNPTETLILPFENPRIPCMPVLQDELWGRSETLPNPEDI